MATPRSQRRDPSDTTTITSSGSQSLRPTNSAASASSGASSSPARQIATPDGFVSAALASVAGPPPTFAAFSPATLSTTSAAKRRSTILVHEKSPLLLATPPQITRALAYSHPFLLPLNKVVGLLTWTSGDPWESFLIVAGFWAAVLYGDILLRVLGPVLLVVCLSIGMYGRRFSPLSSSGWRESGSKDGSEQQQQQSKGKKPAAGKSQTSAANGSAGAGGGGGAATNRTEGASSTGASGAHGHQRGNSTAEATGTRHSKTLDEMVETLREFTSRCNILLEPLLELTDFLSTQQTPTSATTRPALQTLLIRIVLCTPFWIALTLPPWRIVTARRVMLVAGTVVLTWHARVCCVGRVLLWRSRTVRRLTALITGLEFDGVGPATGSFGTSGSDVSSTASTTGANGAPHGQGQGKVGAAGTAGRESELTRAIRRSRGMGQGTGVRFTFIIYENQRRWVGLGWTTSMFAYERGPWTDERNNKVPPRDKFELPEVEESGKMRWRWVVGSRWRVDGVPDDAVINDSKKPVDGEWNYDGEGGKMGWVYYDNKWQNGRRGQDSWRCWTRRRKWYRDAELVEVDPNEIDNNQSEASSEVTAVPTFTDGQTSSGIATPSISYSSASASQQRESDDAVSLLSSSSRSGRSGTTMSTSTAKGPGLRRRAGGSSVDTASSSRRPRRTSSAAASTLDQEHEDTAASLGTSLGLEIQGAGMERDQWGVGDDLRMSLE